MAEPVSRTWGDGLGHALRLPVFEIKRQSAHKEQCRPHGALGFRTRAFEGQHPACREQCPAPPDGDGRAGVAGFHHCHCRGAGGEHTRAAQAEGLCEKTL